MINPTRRSVNQSTKLPSCLQSREGWSRYLDMRLTKQPHLHQIEPTNHCPYTCVMCPRKKMTRPLGFMEASLYTKVFDEVAGFAEPVRSMEIELFHFGEALLHPQIDEMIRYASNLNLNTVLSVNADQLEPALVQRIIPGAPREIIISMDGFDEQSHTALKGKSVAFAKAINNVENLIQVNRDNGSRTNICVRMIKLNSNKKSWNDFLRFWEDKGVTAKLRDFYPWSDKSLSDLGEFDKYPTGMPCPFPWQYLVVQWNGDVVPCCRDYDASNKIGNVKDQSLEALWNSPQLDEFRQQHRDGNYEGNPLCKECMEIYYTPE